MTAVRAYMWDMAGREGMILCGRQFMNSLDDSSMEEIKAAISSEPWLHRHFDIGEKYIRTHSKRINYKFAGLDRSLDSIKSKSRILLCWVDEAEPVTDEAWIKLIPTLREEDSELWVTWNPERKRSSTHKRFREATDQRQKVVQLNWRDNPWFPDVLDRTRQRDMKARPEQYGHIWEGDFSSVFEGAYYVRELIAVKDSGRLRHVPAEPQLPVHTAWDLGIGDSTAIWFFQVVGPEIRIIDFYESSGQGLPHYASVLKAKGYQYGDDWVPHDAKVRELGTGRTRVETLQELGRKPKLIPNHTLMDGINAVRETLPHCWFDEQRTDFGLDALRQYRSEYDEKANVFDDRPLHDWTSHAADAFRYLAMAWKEMKAEVPAPPPKKNHILEVGKDGVLRSNMSVKEIIEMNRRKRAVND
ncbi:Phage terminase large subunit [uncultured Caudovirales phage]|uniref:Phage terminase large subunit n=1 Tax=uncultured Caudovirales phage TaxID=2100421 RepID=A0A6J5MLJ5_9CAUD|nr:Phage terminase large subunit [uncultured Caudovirales phage]CAB4164651.1 Phage terminase large subunit [uncultured Caudovirales phage]CAB4172358.1 Phage terminase large subunit [uncultured Caudovirales phage]CAB4177535.1 Phage terminase large subunit [uncultured Caudovirales phage]CAB4183762.1 Phage terminase large subunit [uncultured Caudovirales phage]